MTTIKEIIRTKLVIKDIYPLTFRQLIDLKDIEIPDIQVDLDEDRINGIVESYDKNPQFFTAKSLLTVANLETSDCNKYYLVDGQHRLAAIKKIVETKPGENQYILISIIKTENRFQLIRLFKELNIDSKKCPKLSNFEWIIIEKIKDKLKLKYKDLLPNTSSKRHNIYTISEFVELLQKNNIFQKLDDKYKFKKLNDDDILNNDETELINKDEDYINDMIKKIDKKQKEFFSKCNYLEISLDPNKIKLYMLGSKEIELIKINICMFLKRNNFIDYIGSSSVPKHFEIDTEPISEDLRKKVWYKEFGDYNSGKCPIYNCQTPVLDRTKLNGWHCGHLISRKNGGFTVVNNLRPICSGCNIRMSSTNWDEYNDMEKKKHLIEMLFDENENEIKCKRKGCPNKISKETLLYYEKIINGKNKITACCKTCYENNKIPLNINTK